MFDVFDSDFKKIGTINADNSQDALQEAKRKFPFVVAPMVQQSKTRTPDPLPAAIYPRKRN
jgi:hypothetical protein